MTDRGTVPSDDDLVTVLLGRPPRGAYRVAVRRHDHSPVVLANAPLLRDGTPMPTRFWLCDPVLVREVSALESEGGVRRAEQEVSAASIARTHERAAAERDSLIDPAYRGPRPFGGVGGTRRGVKCLHTHLANHLAGAPDAVGAWVVNELARRGRSFDPAERGILST